MLSVDVRLFNELVQYENIVYTPRGITVPYARLGENVCVPPLYKTATPQVARILKLGTIAS